MESNRVEYLHPFYLPFTILLLELKESRYECLINNGALRYAVDTTLLSPSTTSLNAMISLCEVHCIQYVEYCDTFLYHQIHEIS